MAIFVQLMRLIIENNCTKMNIRVLNFKAKEKKIQMTAAIKVSKRTKETSRLKTVEKIIGATSYTLGL